jgi:hypothetical protein
MFFVVLNLKRFDFILIFNLTSFKMILYFKTGLIIKWVLRELYKAVDYNITLLNTSSLSLLLIYFNKLFILILLIL